MSRPSVAALVAQWIVPGIWLGAYCGFVGVLGWVTGAAAGCLAGGPAWLPVGGTAGLALMAAGVLLADPRSRGGVYVFHAFGIWGGIMAGGILGALLLDLRFGLVVGWGVGAVAGLLSTVFWPTPPMREMLRCALLAAAGAGLAGLVGSTVGGVTGWAVGGALGMLLTGVAVGLLRADQEGGGTDRGVWFWVWHWTVAGGIAGALAGGLGAVVAAHVAALPVEPAGSGGPPLDLGDPALNFALRARFPAVALTLLTLLAWVVVALGMVRLPSLSGQQGPGPAQEEQEPGTLR